MSEQEAIKDARRRLGRQLAAWRLKAGLTQGQLARRTGAIEEAVTIRHQLAQARPDAFLPDLASSLNNQSNRLSELGRREEALAAIEEAVTIRRQLAQARPRIFSERLISSSRVLAGVLDSLDRSSEAEQVRAEAAGLQ